MAWTSWRRHPGLILSVVAAVVIASVLTVTAKTSGAATLEPKQVRKLASSAGLASLATVPLPSVDLSNFVKTEDPTALPMLAMLGKALFWDMQVGSDGQACGSCHFHAGADNRTKNQLDPGLKGGDTAFGGPGHPNFGPNYTVSAADFPFHTATADTDDVMSSQGVFNANFNTSGPQPVPGAGFDSGTASLDPVFHVGSINTRRVEPRHTPSVDNAVFNVANFWDGRAHMDFNGVDPFGPLDNKASVLLNQAGTLQQTTVSIANSSLASQATGPPTNSTEMSFNNRAFAQVAHKVFALTPLGLQHVDRTDSVLGPIANPTTGLTITYPQEIQSIFQDRWWNSSQLTGGFTQMEANFSLFFGLAVQQYERTLISDQTPFDQFMAGDDSMLTQDQLRGLLVFIHVPESTDATFSGTSIGNCIGCHTGPALSKETFPALTKLGKLNLTDTDQTTTLDSSGNLAVSPDLTFIDEGFFNTGVRPTSEDPGRGGTGPNGIPLSYVKQALAGFSFGNLPACGGKSQSPCPTNNRTQVAGAFKVPQLRNVDLRGPFFHNGGEATLKQVMGFYLRQSDFARQNIGDVYFEMARIHLAATDLDSVVSFMQALTDPRVRSESAPFDHPEIKVPNGSPGNQTSITCVNPDGITACDDRIDVPATGAAGGPPLTTFLGLDPHTS